MKELTEQERKRIEQLQLQIDWLKERFPLEFQKYPGHWIEITHPDWDYWNPKEDYRRKPALRKGGEVSEQKTFWFVYVDFNGVVKVESAVGKLTASQATFSGHFQCTDYRRRIERRFLHETREAALAAFIKKNESNIAINEANIADCRKLIAAAKLEASR